VTENIATTRTVRRVFPVLAMAIAQLFHFKLDKIPSPHRNEW
jgi:hypothetical protein